MSGNIIRGNSVAEDKELRLPLLISKNIIPFLDEKQQFKVARKASIEAVDESIKNFDSLIVVAPQKSLKDKKITNRNISCVGSICEVKIIEDNRNNENNDLLIEILPKEHVLIDVENAVPSFDQPALTIYEKLEFALTCNFDYCFITRILVTELSDLIGAILNSNISLPKPLANKFNTWAAKVESTLNEILMDVDEQPQTCIPELKGVKVVKIASKFLYFLFNVDFSKTIFKTQALFYEAFTNAFDEFHSFDLFIDSLMTLIAGFTIDPKDNDIFEKQVTDSINNKMHSNMSKQQKEFYLREKLRIIKEELGEISSRDDDSQSIHRRLKEGRYPKRIKDKILSELAKYESAFTSNESGMIKSYIDWLLDLPWWQTSTDNLDLIKVQEVLDKNHYGIDKVKERIIEYIAMKTNNPDANGSIICLVGPPGVGKTSLARSIADALQKTYVKVSLGGVKDESEIRGHRRTYLGAMPGRIIKAMKKAKVINPLFLLDEIDKMSSDFKGDPASAMLEVLDPEQNKLFSDNYIEEEYDLSKVMFVCTANYYNQIPPALIDRLEIIELSSYTANEKKQIAKNHLIKRVLEKANMKQKELKFTDDAIDFIINYYTREAGVRELERLIEQIVRKILVQKLKKQEYDTVITEDVVSKLLGKKRFDMTLKDKENIPGVVNGMAYTSAGGDLLPIEATYFPGKGNIVITGNLEKTMNESVNVAFGYVKANAKKYGIEDIKFSEIDVHLHVPAGGVPKDGPSAGVTITTALISLFKQVPVASDISMTGEIMLRGKVGIIGGVKEKVISAFRAGVRNIFIPKDDERFLEDVPKEILSKVKINLVDVYDDIYQKLFK